MVANGGVATDIAVIFLIEVGCGEFTIDFTKHFTPSWLSLSVMGALACSCGDTYSSELGPVLGNSEPRLITSLGTKVPRGYYLLVIIFVSKYYRIEIDRIDLFVELKQFD